MSSEETPCAVGSSPPRRLSSSSLSAWSVSLVLYAYSPDQAEKVHSYGWPSDTNYSSFKHAWPSNTAIHLAHGSQAVGEDSMLRRVHPKKRSVSWVNSVPRQFLPNGSLLWAAGHHEIPGLTAAVKGREKTSGEPKAVIG